MSKYVDFEVVKERWGKYNLDDESILKIKFILTHIKSEEQDGRKKKYNANIQNIQTIYPAEHLMGEPQKAVFNNQMIMQNVEKDDVSFDPLEIPVNEYILDDRTKLKVFPQVIKVIRSSLKNKFGEPIYMVNTNVTINFDPPSLI